MVNTRSHRKGRSNVKAKHPYHANQGNDSHIFEDIGKEIYSLKKTLKSIFDTCFPFLKSSYKNLTL